MLIINFEQNEFMQFLDILQGTQSKTKVLKAIAYIDKSPLKFQKFVDEFMQSSGRDSQKLAWIIGTIADSDKELIVSHVEDFLNKLNEPCHAAVKRNILRAIDIAGVPKPFIGHAADVAFKLLEDVEEPVAVRVFAMSILHKICLLEPELSTELIALLEDQIPYGSAGYRSRASKIIESLAK